MTTDFDNAIGDMTADLLAEAGKSVVYRRNTTSTTLTLRMSAQRPQVVETEGGSVVEVRSIDWIGLTASLPYDPPEPGDLIIDGGDTYKVAAQMSEKAWRRIGPQMTRIHSVKVT